MGSGFFQGQYCGDLIDPSMSGWEERTGRGGYAFPAYRHGEEEAVAVAEHEEVYDRLWDETIGFYKILMPVAESAGVLMAQHGVGYDRALDYDHVVKTNGDSYIGRQSVAFSAGYIRGLLAGL